MKNFILKPLLLSLLTILSLYADAPFITNTLSMAEMQKIIASGAVSGDYFGGSVSVDGDTVVVGAYNENNWQGAAYVYIFNQDIGQYEQKAKLVVSDPEGKERLGVSVAIDNNVIVIGALSGANYNGAAYLYVEPIGGWINAIETAELTASDGGFTDRFGVSVAIDGEIVVVGANQDDDGGENSGSVYLFVKPDSGWYSKYEDAYLTASDIAASDAFGMAVAIDGDTVVVGALGHSDGGVNTNSGAIYIYEKPNLGWDGNITEDAKLLPSPAPASNIYMGRSVDISGDTIVAGAEWDDGGNINSGSVYVFEKPIGGWSNNTEDAKLISSDAMTDDQFGVSVSIDNDTIIVGAYDYNDLTDLGSAYLFKKPTNGWHNTTQDVKFTASDESAGDAYGCSVYISDETIAIGAFGNDDAGDDSGSVYIIKKSVVTNVVENNIIAIDINASDANIGDTIDYSFIGGEDASLLTIDVATGLVKFKSAPDYENPMDNNHDNIYKAVMMVKDDFGEYTYNPLILPISNLVYEGKSLSIENLDEIQNIPGFTEYDEFGYAIAIEGSFLVVGAPYNDSSGNNMGAIYLYKYNTTNNQYEHIALLGTVALGVESLSGISVAIDNDTIVVGAYRSDENGTDSGSAYVFEKPATGWANNVRNAKLLASDATANDNFGVSVAVSGDMVAIGAWGNDNAGGIDAGSVYIFKKPSSGWKDKTEDAKLTASDASASDVFGNSISFSGNTLVVGALNNDDSGDNSGSVYIFEKPIWGWQNKTENVKLTASDASAGANFGTSVAINGDTVVVGAEGDAEHSGSAYIFEKPLSGWSAKTENAKLTPLVTDSWKYFGNRVAVSGDTVVIGAHGANAAYLFKKPTTGWTNKHEDKKLTASDTNPYDYFGGSVAISGDTVAIGAFYKNSGTGAVYIFTDKNKSIVIMAPIISYLLN